MPSEIKVAHRVKRCFKAGQFCGSETEIVITLPQKDYKRLTRSLGWRSVHWPARRRGRPRKLTNKPVENCSPRRRAPEPMVVSDPLVLLPSLADKPKDLGIQLPRLRAATKRRVKKPRAMRVSTIACNPFAVEHTATYVPGLITTVVKPPMATHAVVEACEPDMYTDRYAPPADSAWQPPKGYTPPKAYVPPAKTVTPRGRSRVSEGDRFVEPDVPYVLQTLREMLAVAEQKEAYHAAALRAVQGPRVAQKRKAFAILPLLRKVCIRPLQKAIKKLEEQQK